MATKRKYYAVAAGYQPGIYETWDECKIQVYGFRGGKHKSFPTKAEALKYLEEESASALLGKDLQVIKSESKHMKQSSATKESSISTQLKRSSQATEALANNPFKSFGFRVPSSVLDMAPADYEDCVDPNKPDSAQAVAPLQLLAASHLSANLESVSDVNVLYQLEYDGACRGNPGAAGAGALLRHPDGTVVCEISVGLGKATNNVAEYRGLIAGMSQALELGIQRIQAQGDSKLVTMQIRGIWKIKNRNLQVLCEEAKSLLKNFHEFQIRNVGREWNSAADALANKGVGLPEEKFVSTFSHVTELLEKSMSR